MKKFLLFILSVIYLVVASGVGFHLHYCMDKLVSFSWSEKRNKCTACGKPESYAATLASKNCCRDEYKLLKIANAHKAEQTISPNFFITDIVQPFPGVAPFTVAFANNVAWNVIHAPPPKYKVPSFLFNCIFRI